MKRKKLIFLIVISLFAGRGFEASSPQANQAWDGSQISPVHQIPLKDEFDQDIIPAEPYPLPFSSRYTCAPCHDYKVIQHGLHFDANQSKSTGRVGEPWVWVDEKTGTLLPLSYKNWKGMWNPKEVGLTAWDFSLLFGRHLTGGGVAEPADEDITPDSRWNVSGKIEINCLGCHNPSNVQNHSEWVKQILRQNFRWAATAASGLGEVKGMASRLPGTWDVFDGPNPDDTEWAVVPSVRYNQNLFDSRHRAFLDISHKPDDSRCLACHSVAPFDMKKFNFDEDVHSAAGLKCVSCHRNDIHHAMIRGYEGEANDYPEQPIEDFTCSGCHLGNKLAREGEGLPGRLGAPYPQHKGIPAVHFDRLSCTVCHAGPLPGKELTRVRTSRANRLGIYGIAKWATDLPVILEPVYIRDKNKKLTPHRLLWPAFWAEIEGGKISPLRPERVLAAAGEILNVEENVAGILKTLVTSLELDGSPVIILSGKVYELNADGGLDVSPLAGEAAVEEVVWAIKKDGKIVPLIPQFDPNAVKQSSDIEALIQKILEALATIPDASGKPVLVYKNVIYQVTNGYLEKTEKPNQTVSKPQLCWLNGDKIQPLVSEFERRTVSVTVGSEKTLTEEQVELVLEVLAFDNKSQKIQQTTNFAYISSGKMFRLNEKGKFESRDHEAAEPVVWPLAHRVRPARQSLGVNGCGDCHKLNSHFFFTKVRGTGPLQTESIKVRSGNSFMKLDKPYQLLFGLSFAVRPFFKVVLFVSTVVAGSILFIVFLIVLGRLSGLIERRR